MSIRNYIKKNRRQSSIAYSTICSGATSLNTPQLAAGSFIGRRYVKENELEEESTNSSYKADGKIHAQERDIAKYWRKGLVRIALYGLENQTDIDGDMPLRLFSYDGAAYRSQILKDKEMKEKTGMAAPRYPVVTLVLYFGYQKHWKKRSHYMIVLIFQKN